MNLTVDIGNTRSKLTLFDGTRVAATGVAASGAELSQWLQAAAPAGEPERAIVAAVGRADDLLQWLRGHFGSRLVEFGSHLSLPVALGYATPQTLGADRLATAVGARCRVGNRPALVVDAGTCITADLVDAAGTYCGGSISPGLRMRAEALHRHTARLPRLDSLPEHPTLPGTTTLQSIEAGVVQGARLEIQGWADYYSRRYPHLQVFLTGGDSRLLAAGLSAAYTLCPHLLAEGLNYTLNPIPPSPIAL